MNLDQIGEWLKSQTTPASRKLVIGYAMNLAVGAEMRDQAKNAGVSESTLKMVEAAGPLLGAQLQKLLGA